MLCSRCPASACLCQYVSTFGSAPHHSASDLRTGLGQSKCCGCSNFGGGCFRADSYDRVTCLLRYVFVPLLSPFARLPGPSQHGGSQDASRIYGSQVPRPTLGQRWRTTTTGMRQLRTSPRTSPCFSTDYILRWANVGWSVAPDLPHASQAVLAWMCFSQHSPDASQILQL